VGDVSYPGVERMRAVDRMKSQGDVKGLERALREDCYCWVREAAAKAMGEIGDGRAAFSLQYALRDRYWEVRQAAASALIAVDKGTDAKRAIADYKEREKNIWLVAERMRGVGVGPFGNLDLSRAEREAPGGVDSQPGFVLDTQGIGEHGRAILRSSTSGERQDWEDQQFADTLLLQAAFDSRPEGWQSGSDFDFLGFWGRDLTEATASDVERRFEESLPISIYSKEKTRSLIQAFWWMLNCGLRFDYCHGGIPILSKHINVLAAGDPDSFNSRKRMILVLHDCVEHGANPFALEVYVGSLA
jgi:hypothetical protein